MPDSMRPIGLNSHHHSHSTAFDKTNPIFTPDVDPVRTALDRAAESVLGSLAPTLRAACNVVQPGATPRNPMQPNRATRKTNPIPPVPGFATSVASSSRSNEVLGRDAQPTKGAHPACNATQPGATPRDATQPNSAPYKTNPIASHDGLDPRQLAAARLLAIGRSVPDVARELKLNRTTVWRWQREPAFKAELRRVHDRMVVASSVRPVHPPRSGVSTRGV
jgi:hypothetical protein